jgi:tetratricopeptide (TPR) repeat protein
MCGILPPTACCPYRRNRRNRTGPFAFSPIASSLPDLFPIMRSARFQPLVEQYPDNEMFRFSLGQALVEEDRPAEAIPHLEMCAARKSDWMLARILLGKALIATGRPGEARPILEEALRLAIAQSHEAPAAELQALLADLEPRRTA